MGYRLTLDNASNASGRRATTNIREMSDERLQQLWDDEMERHANGAGDPIMLAYIQRECNRRHAEGASKQSGN